jgi:hypothetical protein
MGEGQKTVDPKGMIGNKRSKAFKEGERKEW